MRIEEISVGQKIGTDAQITAHSTSNAERTMMTGEFQERSNVGAVAALVVTMYAKRIAEVVATLFGGE